MNTEITEKVSRVFSKVFEKQIPFSPNLEMKSNRAWTSLKHVVFIIELERFFGIRFDAATVTRMQSIPIIVSEIQQRLSNA